MAGTTAVERRKVARAEAMARRVRYPGLCGLCGGEHYTEPDESVAPCVLCGVRHLGYCGAPTVYAKPRRKTLHLPGGSKMEEPDGETYPKGPQGLQGDPP